MSADSSPILIDKDASRFLHQCGYMYRDEQSISKSLLCPICSEPWIQPVVAAGCGHMFCEKCIHTWIRHIPSCPIDRSSLPSNQLTQPPQILKELVDELVVICSLGCGWTGRRDSWKRHLETQCPEAKRDEQTIPSALLTEKIDPVEPVNEEDTFKERWKKLAREMHVLKKEAKDYISTIERYKDKVSQLQLELRQANELIVVNPPSPSPVSSPSALPLHQATCNFCRSHIQGTRHKCLKCPDLDSCSECFADIANLHPVHDFVPIHSPSDLDVVCLPEWFIVHPNFVSSLFGLASPGPSDWSPYDSICQPSKLIALFKIHFLSLTSKRIRQAHRTAEWTHHEIRFNSSFFVITLHS
ncbi:hypothetical protein PCASD_11068 [Puccinia coronata f. sp. avenae]|uniref:RING-type domain-containing protein n=1 Tax=Puccinia coronata f. sp. avenae TaxID=200324 RepID=A0A2N5RZ04_9BASI|nr:hypothetical protein PCASD_23804 [Puccinia coronata f. sp. avenae]PLW31217.1 hypothetical protein PCASD_11068 [Puccinia coronata f. sp. avenae]